MENKQSNLYIFIENGNIDVVVLSGYRREEGFEELNRLQDSYEKMGKHYQFELTDNYGNTIFKN